MRDGAADASRPGEDGAADGPRLPEGVSVVGEAPDCGAAPVLDLAILTSTTVYHHQTGPCDALAVELDGLISASTYAVEFGELKPGQESPPKTIKFRYQGPEGAQPP